MSFLKNAWYPAMWAKDIADQPISVTVIEMTLAIFRDGDGEVKALRDACPHRFAPLSLGKLKDGILACAYHGLEFDGTGACIHNPHGKGTVSSALNVPSYSAHERYGMIWVWMGDQGRADESMIPHLPYFEDPGLVWIYGELNVDANYELIIDNLLDLTHVEFLHPLLASPGNAARTTFRAEQQGDSVSAYYDVENEPITGLFQLLWERPEDVGKLIAYMHWDAPACLSLQAGMSVNDQVGVDDPRINVMHLLCPQGPEQTRYFWAAGRNKAKENPEVSKMLFFGTQHAFENEDEPMIRAVRSRMTSNDIFANKAALLPIDEAGVCARRILKRLITSEASA